jgi:hypothetical protein
LNIRKAASESERDIGVNDTEQERREKSTEMPNSKNVSFSPCEEVEFHANKDKPSFDVLLRSFEDPFFGDNEPASGILSQNFETALLRSTEDIKTNFFDIDAADNCENSDVGHENADQNDNVFLAFFYEQMLMDFSEEAI